ncbi:MAG TPA: aminomethyl-transferring glycine dehydrogenase subunit GcvPA [Coriobacteriia bacterium]|nr:aminomethyl-transferring glycine dehydrogenase subunit GcvPA [Coriobacteriia bacterium]
MRYIPVTCEQREAMLRAVGVERVEELFADVPEKALLNRPLELPAGMSEIDLARHLKSLSGANIPASWIVNFAGAGVYDHHVPSVVDHVLRKPEFFTAYTPYQPEVSQGTLQAIFEYQSMICALTGMDVANASMYDGATAFVEAALMACRVTKRQKVLVAGSVHPEWIEVMYTYAEAGHVDVEVIDFDGGRLDPTQVADAMDASVAAVLVASPNFVGVLEDLDALGKIAHGEGALFVVAANPIMLGIMEPPSTFGADIVVGEGQPLGNAMSFGGPGLGFFACRQKNVRQMPGRLVGQTVDADGQKAYVLTLSTREQHIRREKATSNICSNHALNALAAGAYLAAVGSVGLSEIARACVAKARYLRDRLIETGKFAAPWEDPFGYEFALTYKGDADEMHARMFERGFFAGIILSVEDEHDMILFAVTEKRTREEMDAFAEEVAAL